MTEAAPTAHRSRWPGVVAWALTLVAILALAWMTVSFISRCTPAGIAEAASANIRDLLKPTITVSPLVVLRGEDRTPKLVVFTHTLDVTVPLSEEAWYGSSYSSAEARNCRAQFIIPIDRMSDDDVLLTAGKEGEPARIVIIAPRPQLDTDMLVIAPEDIKFTDRKTGLTYVTRLFSGPDKERLTRLIRPAAVEALSDPDLRKRAEEAGREFFEKSFAEMLRSELKVGRDVVVQVRWVDE